MNQQRDVLKREKRETSLLLRCCCCSGRVISVFTVKSALRLVLKLTPDIKPQHRLRRGRDIWSIPLHARIGRVKTVVSPSQPGKARPGDSHSRAKESQSYDGARRESRRHQGYDEVAILRVLEERRQNALGGLAIRRNKQLLRPPMETGTAKGDQLAAAAAALLRCPPLPFARYGGASFLLTRLVLFAFPTTDPAASPAMKEQLLQERSAE